MKYFVFVENLTKIIFLNICISKAFSGRVKISCILCIIDKKVQRFM